MTDHPIDIEPAFPRRVVPVFIALAFSTLGTAFLQMGFFFYAAAKWGWSPRQNLGLAAAEGVVYVVGALCSSGIAARLGRRGLGIVLPVLFAVVGVACGLFANRPEVVTPLLIVLYFLTAVYWPCLESLVATGTDAHRMARRLSVYNLVWPAIGAAGTAVCGVVIAHLPIGFFYVSAGVNLVAGVIIAMGGEQPEEKRDGNGAKGREGEKGHGHSEAEPELVAQRKLALYLSRIALPSTYLVSYALAALMPTLPSLAAENVSTQTAVGSLWLAGRWLGFSALAIWSFWHTRPRLLIVATGVMLVTFVAVCVPEMVVPGGSAMARLWVMGSAQIVLGWALALIYSGSLYFGMVLSDGSTEHGGYHEALIGLGQVLGPGVAAGAQTIRPGSILPAVIAVTAMIFVSLIVSCMAAAKAPRGRAG